MANVTIDINSDGTWPDTDIPPNTNKIIFDPGDSYTIDVSDSEFPQNKGFSNKGAEGKKLKVDYAKPADITTDTPVTADVPVTATAGDDLQTSSGRAMLTLKP